MGCELCGKEGELLLADVEQVEMNVCPSCAEFGKIKSSFRSSSSASQRKSIIAEEPEFEIVLDYASLIRKAREQRNMSQKEFAAFLNERESLVQKWEQGSMPPAIDVARRLEKKLGISLIQQDEKGKILNPEKAPKLSDSFTLGDFIKIRKR